MTFSRFFAVQAFLFLQVQDVPLTAAFVPNHLNLPRNAIPLMEGSISGTGASTRTASTSTTTTAAHKLRQMKMELHSSRDKNSIDDPFGFFDDEFNRIIGMDMVYDEDIDEIDEDDDDDDDFNAIPQYQLKYMFDVDDEMKPEDVHIILFNPDTDREGVHTIEFPKESGNNMILAFESREECEEFSASLKRQQFFDPTPQETKLEALENYCAQIGVEVQVIPEGMKLTPPKESVLNLGLNPDLEKEMKMLDYLFHISSSAGDSEGCRSSNEGNDDDRGAGVGHGHDETEDFGAWE